MPIYILGRQAEKKGFVKCFLNVPLACLGSMARPVELSEISLQNLFHNLPPQTVL